MAQTKVKLIADDVIVQSNLNASHGITTADIGENASYLYYTDARVSSYLSTNGYATQTDIVAAITDSAPVTLDTLNELAAALGDDPNFATTTATSLGLKAPLASPSFTGNATFAGNVTSTEVKVVNSSATSTLYAESDTLALVQLKDDGLNKTYNIEIGRSSTAGDLTFRSSDGEKVRFTEAGNVGIGVTPSSTNAITTQITNGLSLFGNNSTPYGFISNNHAWTNPGGDQYLVSNYGASYYKQYQGAHSWATAPSGTAGSTATFTPRMTILQGGNVGIGDTSPSTKIDVYQSTVGIGVADFRHVNGNRILINPSYNYYDAYNHIFRGLNGTDTHMTIDLNGNVGIGTTSPGSTLELYGNTSSGGYGVYPALTIKNDNASGFSAVHFNQSTNQKARIEVSNSAGSMGLYTGSGANGITILNNSNVGIGTTSPGYAFTVFKSITNDWLALFGNTYNGAGNGVLIDAGNGSSGEILRLRDKDGNSKVSFLSNGNVGIGTTSPQSKLQVAQPGNRNGGTILMGVGGSGTNKYSVLAGTHYNQASGSGNGAGSAGIMLIGSYATNGENDVIIGGNVWEVNAATTIKFYTHTTDTSTNGGSERMRITSGGTVSNTGTTILGGGAAEGVTGWNLAPGNGTIVTSSDSDSNMYIGKVSGYSNDRFISFYVNGSLVGRITTNGSTTSYVTTSDYRAKENIVEMTGALDRVSQLKPSRFNFIADADKTVDGFLAHEVQEIVPEAITGQKDAVDEEGNPDYQGIDQSKLVPLLVGAIQELKAEIETLKTQING